MTIALGCIADDYTGASDLANTLSKAGLRTVQTIGVPDDLALPDMDAVVVALKSRSIEAAKAVALSRAADQWLRAHGAGHVLFKIRLHRCRQHRTGDRRARLRCRRGDRAGHTGLSGDRPHGLPG